MRSSEPQVRFLGVWGQPPTREIVKYGVRLILRFSRLVRTGAVLATKWNGVYWGCIDVFNNIKSVDLLVYDI